MKYSLIILTAFLLLLSNQAQAQAKDRPGIPTVMYTWVLKNGQLVKRSIITCDGNKSYNCFDLVNKDDKPVEYVKPIDKYEIDDSKFSYIKDGIKFEEVGTLKRFEEFTKAGSSSYIIEMAIKN